MARLLFAAAFAAAMQIAGAAAQDYPTRPITMIVPFPAGGPTDVIGRVLTERMRALLGQPVILENVAALQAILASGALPARRLMATQSLSAS